MSIPTRCMLLGHQGEFFKVKGPLNIARAGSGFFRWSAQAGSSEPGQQLAARTADLVYYRTAETRRARSNFYRSLKGRLAAEGACRGIAEDHAGYPADHRAHACGSDGTSGTAETRSFTRR